MYWLVPADKILPTDQSRPSSRPTYGGLYDCLLSQPVITGQLRLLLHSGPSVLRPEIEVELCSPPGLGLLSPLLIPGLLSLSVSGSLKMFLLDFSLFDLPVLHLRHDRIFSLLRLESFVPEGDGIWSS